MHSLTVKNPPLAVQCPVNRLMFPRELEQLKKACLRCSNVVSRSFVVVDQFETDWMRTTCCDCICIPSWTLNPFVTVWGKAHAS